MPTLRRMFSRGWVLTTLLVFTATLVLIRLGIWQLDRLEQRRAFNAQVLSAVARPVLELSREVPTGIEEMEWRSVRATGRYDFENQITLRNQYYQNQLGYHLITPLLFPGGAVLVDRGWIPAEGNATPEDWRKYDDAGESTVTGQIRLGLEKPAYGGVDDPVTGPGEKLFIWNNLDPDRLADQIPYPLLPVLIQPVMDPTDTTPPIPFQPELDLTEGPHFGYALQWFTFAGILIIGYPFYLRKQEQA